MYSSLEENVKIVFKFAKTDFLLHCLCTLFIFSDVLWASLLASELCHAQAGDGQSSTYASTKKISVYKTHVNLLTTLFGLRKHLDTTLLKE